MQSDHAPVRETYRQATTPFLPELQTVVTWLPIIAVTPIAIHWIGAGFPLVPFRPSSLAVAAFIAAIVPYLVLMLLAYVGPRGPLRRLYRDSITYTVDRDGVTVHDGHRHVRLDWGQIGGYRESVEYGGIGAIRGRAGEELVRVPDHVIGADGKRRRSNVLLGEALLRVDPGRSGGKSETTLPAK